MAYNCQLILKFVTGIEDVLFLFGIQVFKTPTEDNENQCSKNLSEQRWFLAEFSIQTTQQSNATAYSPFRRISPGN